MEIYSLSKDGVSLRKIVDGRSDFIPLINSPMGRDRLRELSNNSAITQQQYAEIIGIWGEHPTQADDAPPIDTVGMEQAQQQSYAATKLQTIAMLADIGVVNMEDAATITASMEIDLSTIAKPWTVGTWYSAGDTVDHNGDYYLVRDPHAAQAHQPPGAEGVYHYIPIPSTEDGYPVFEMGMYVHTGMIVWDTGKTQLYKCILPNITEDKPYQCHYAPGSAPTVWEKYDAA